MSGVFINYRRDDSAGYAGRLSDRLSAHFGAHKVFLDVTDIEPGLDFVEAIRKGIGSCEALLVLMSKQWLEARAADGSRRLDDPHDHLRLEIAAALQRNVRVIPLLVRGARMPDAQELPEDIVALARKHAIELSDDRWDFDVGRLISVLEKLLGKPSASAPKPEPEPSKRSGGAPWKLVAGGAVLGVAALVGISVVVEEGYLEDDYGDDYGNITVSPPPVDPDALAMDAATAPFSSAPTATSSVAGTWYNDQGVRYEIGQQGNDLQSYVYDAFGNLIATGIGVREGAGVQLQYTYQVGGGGVLSGMLRGDQRHIDFSYTDYVSGMSVNGQLHLNHYAGH
ncbi:MAG: toll/interleukin-1 receptor domain-containing protein [Pseudomonadota bacterium]